MNALLLAAALASPAGAAKVAGAAVTSEKWTVRRSPVMEEEFSGNVRYKSGPNQFEADWALYQHEKELWKARGAVRLQRRLDSGELVEAEADEGWFASKAQKGELRARRAVRFKRQPAEGPPDLGRAGRASWTGPEHLLLEENVRLEGPRLEAAADRADYRFKAGELLLSGGRPSVRKHPGWSGPGDDWGGAWVADETRAWRTGRRIAATGKARGWLQFPRREKK